MADYFTAAPWYMPPVVSALVVAPVEEPLTLDEAKLRAGLDWAPGDPRDALMKSFIAAARAQVELDTGLALLTQTRAITFSDATWFAADNGVVPLPMQSLPLQSLTDPGGNPVSPTTYRTGYEQRLSILRFASGFQAGTWTAIVGWKTAADLAKNAPLLLQAVGLLVGHMATAGRDLATVGTIVTPTPQGYRDCIDRYALVTLA